MADNVISIMIFTASGTDVVLATSGSYDLRADPFTSTGIVGTYSGGTWNFTGLDDTVGYKLYNTSTGNEVENFTGGGDNTRKFFDGDLQLYLKKSGGTMTGAIAMGGNKITGAGAASANGDLTRYEQVWRTTGAQTGLSGTKVTTDLIYYSPSDITITGDGALTSKKYVDDLFGGAVGVVQSGYKIKLIPTRATNDTYSKNTAELCNAYLSGLTDISTRTGTILVESLGQASNTINLDDGTSQWISPGVWYVGQGSKPILNRRAPNGSLTVAGGIVNCRIKDGAAGVPVVSSRTYVNFTFQDCEFDVPDETDITFTTCKFLGINKLKSASGNTITLTNCTGDMFWYNDLITPTVSGTQPADVRAVTGANFNW